VLLLRVALAETDAEQRPFHDRLTNRRQRANKVPLVVNAADVEYEREQS
jgi:hypothetical protein